MKRIFVTCCFILISAGLLMAQSSVKIGNMEITFNKKGEEQDTVTKSVQVAISETPVCKESKKRTYFKTSFFGSLSFMTPESGNDYFRTWGGNTYHLDLGFLHRYNITRWFSLGATFHYSFYNYRLKDALDSPEFVEEVIGHPVDPERVYKQVYRSNNLGVGAFTRFYIVPPKYRSNRSGIYIDVGIQGDFSYSKFFKTKSNSDGNEKYRDGYAFQPFNASGLARIGWNHFAVVAHYRLTDVFNKDVIPMKLPPLSIGIQIF